MFIRISTSLLDIQALYDLANMLSTRMDREAGLDSSTGEPFSNTVEYNEAAYNHLDALFADCIDELESRGITPDEYVNHIHAPQG